MCLKSQSLQYEDKRWPGSLWLANSIPVRETLSQKTISAVPEDGDFTLSTGIHMCDHTFVHMYIHACKYVHACEHARAHTYQIHTQRA